MSSVVTVIICIYLCLVRLDAEQLIKVAFTTFLALSVGVVVPGSRIPSEKFIEGLYQQSYVPTLLSGTT